METPNARGFHGAHVPSQGPGPEERVPSISIVTPTHNRAALIEDAILSVLEQDYAGTVEHIVVDGASTDGTPRILRKYAHLKVVSEPDGGVYDAYNKGIALATGDLVGFLNDDDLYSPNTFNAVGRAFQRDSGVETVAGGAVIFQDTAAGRRVLLTLSERPAERLSIANLNWVTPILNARFFRAGAFRRYGVFDTRYRVEADLELMVRFALARVRGAYIPGDVIWYRSHAGSRTMSGLGVGSGTYTAERLAILRRCLSVRTLSRSDARALRRLHSWQCCTAVSMLPRPIPVRAASRFVVRGLLADPWFTPRTFGYVFSLRRRANPWRGIPRGVNRHLDLD